MPLNHEIPYSIYKEASPLEYWGMLEEVNRIYLSEMQIALQPLMPALVFNRASAIVIGSDGKGEKHAQSRAELIFLQPETGTLQPQHITHIIKGYRKKFEGGYHGYPSVQFVESENPLSYMYGDSNLVYPDTIVNSKFVIGSKTTALQARTQVLYEMIQIPRIRKKLTNQIKEYSVVTQTGISRNKTCFYFENDRVVALYDERPNPKQLGVKPVIRLVQRALDLLTQQQLASAQLTPEYAAQSLPTATVKRLEYFKQDKEIATAYLWFLQWFHETQEGYKNKRQLASASRPLATYLENISLISNWINTIRPGLVKTNGKAD
jgi:hypothetical protein